MSWIFGIYKYKNDVQEINIPAKLKKFELYNSDTFTIYSDISSKIVFSDINEHEGVLVSGIGLDNNQGKLLIGNAWNEKLNFNELDGQYAFLKWSNDDLYLQTDKVGLRKFYIFHDQNKKFSLFSTRLDIVTAAIPNPTINMSALGSYYSLIFSLRKQDSIINDVTKTSPGSVIKFTKEKCNEDYKEWSPSETVDNNIIDMLENTVSLPYKNGYGTILSFSGGLDSRSLLALLNTNVKEKLEAFCAGDRELPDLLLAEEICHKENIPLIKEFYAPQKMGNLYLHLKDVSLRTNMLFGLQNSLFFSGLKNIKSNNSIIIDGAFGELLRTMLGNKLFFNGRKDLLNSDPEVFKKYFSKKVPDFFNSNAKNLFSEGLDSDCESVFKSMPKTSEITVDKWIDLFMIRYRLGSEDSEYIDSVIPNIMPFAQHSILSAMLSIPRSKKTNNKINHQIISKMYPRLKGYPLIRVNRKVPYITSYNNIFSALYFKFMPLYYDNMSSQIVKECFDEIAERINSSSFKACEYYDHEYVFQLFNNFSETECNDTASILLDFFNFDFWQQQCFNKDINI